MREGIEWVLGSKTSYEVAKALNIENRTVNRYQNGNSDISKMTLETAEKLYHYFLDELGKMDREELFSRALAVLNKISVRKRIFVERRPSVEALYMGKFSLAPMTIYTRAMKDVMQYGKTFNEYDLKMLARATLYIGYMDTTTFTDDPLSPKSLIYFANETKALEFKPKKIKGDE